jgi:hypothetical protein
MRILVVTSTARNACSSELLALVTDIGSKNSAALVEGFQVIHRSPNDLQEFLYQPITTSPAHENS